MKLSVVCSGYRVENFKKLYDSIGASFSQDFELVICGPYKPDWQEDNFIFIEDSGSPARCLQRALLAASGDWVSFAWDDGEYLPGKLDEVYKMIEDTGFDLKSAVCGKFYEVVHDLSQREPIARYQEKDDLYYVKTHNEARSELFAEHFLIFGTGMINRKLLLGIGGFDTRYETYAIALLDMSVRLQLHGCNSILKADPVFTCGWSYGVPGHEAVMEAYERNDKELYQKKYRDPNNKPELIMDPENWKTSPRKWRRRFPGVDISIIMPTIRTHLLQAMYESIKECYHGSWELILVGPNPIPASLSSQPNVKWIQSYRTPIACRQQALLASSGDYICYAADDVTFIAGSLDEAYQTCKEHDFDYKFIVAGKYLEDTTAEKKASSVMMTDIYYHLNHHGALQPAMAKFPDWIIVNTGLVSKQLLMEIGGWDSDFEVCSMACCDISMRLQNYGGVVFLQNNPIFHSTWYEGRNGDHAPIHDAHTDHDLPLFTKIWEAPESVDRKVVDLNKWQTTPEKWNRRFQW